MATPPKIFDRPLIARNLERRTSKSPDFVTALALADLAERLATISRPFARALIMAPDPLALPSHGTSQVGAFDFERLGTVIPGPEDGVADPENLTLAHNDYDLIVSIFDTQIVNDVPGFLARVRTHLTPDGLFLGAAIGGLTLTELRQAFLEADAATSGGAFARVAPFIQLGDAGGLLQRAGFALPVTDVETHTVRYGSAFALMAELKALGAANPLADRPTRFATRTLLASAASAYQSLAGDPDGRIRATLEIVWFSGWAPHESQQKPLAPGSAKVSLADVLEKKR